MARVIPFHVPAHFKAPAQRPQSTHKVVEFSKKRPDNNGLWVTLEKMFPHLHPQTSQ